MGMPYSSQSKQLKQLNYLVKQILHFSLANIRWKIADIESSARTATHFPKTNNPIENHEP
jgi:hypothetical protein